MGRGDSELTPDDALAAAEAETRRLLARYGEPSAAPPPSNLADRVIDMLAAPPPTRRLSRPRQAYAVAVGISALALLLLGAWGILLDSSGPAHLFGDLGGGLSQLVLLLTLAAKPLINLLLSAGALSLAVIGAITLGSWLWWQLLRRELATSLEAAI